MGVLGGFDVAQPLADRVGGGLVAGGAVGFAVRKQLLEEGAAFGPEDPGGEEAAQDFGQGVFPDADRPGVGFGLGRGRAAGVMRAGVVGRMVRESPSRLA